MKDHAFLMCSSIFLFILTFQIRIKIICISDLLYFFDFKIEKVSELYNLCAGILSKLYNFLAIKSKQIYSWDQNSDFVGFVFES